MERNRLALRLALVVTLLVGGCAEPGLLLTGQWGGRFIFLVVGDSEAQLQIGCMRATFPRPSLDPVGQFHESAQIVGQSIGSLFVTGDVTGTDMTLAIAYVSPSGYVGPVHYTLRRGALPDFSGVTCLA